MPPKAKSQKIKSKHSGGSHGFFRGIFEFFGYGATFTIILVLGLWALGWFTPCTANFVFISGPLNLPGSQRKCQQLSSGIGNQNVIPVQQTSSGPMVKPATSVVCNFDDGKWIDMDRFKNLSGDGVVLRSPSKKGNEGVAMKYDFKVHPEFDNEIRFIPLTPDKANVIQGFGNIFRGIIGEGSYNTFSLEQNSNFQLTDLVNWVKIKEMNSQNTRPQFRNQIVPKTEVDSSMKVGFDPASNIMKVEYLITYYPVVDPTHTVTQSFEYNLNLPGDPSAVTDLLTVGSINPVATKTSEVDTRFNSCILNQY